MLHEQPPGVHARPSRHPPTRADARHGLEGLGRQPHVLALGRLVNLEVVDPAVPVAHDLMTQLDAGLANIGVALEPGCDGEDARRHLEPLEDAQEPPDPDARAVLERGLRERAALPPRGRPADVGEQALGGTVPVENVPLAARLVGEVKFTVMRAPPGPSGRPGLVRSRRSRARALERSSPPPGLPPRSLTRRARRRRR